jgi:hypothetical protein
VEEIGMGAHPYQYVVEYQPDINAALQALRQREFRAGRYYPALASLSIPGGASSPSPGNRHASIAEAVRAADAIGTRSILDLACVADEPDFGVVTPLGEEVLEELYGTTRPTREMVEEDDGYFGDLERGHGIYIVLYRGDEPDEILFAGYSYD